MKSNMNRTVRVLMVTLSVLLTACSGNVDDTSLPLLTASDTDVDLHTDNDVVFTVTYDGVDVTADSEIYTGLNKIDGNIFIPDAVGTFEFHAVYDGKKSDVIEVVVSDSQVTLESRFDKHVCVVEFTGAWCINCPDGYDRMKGILSKPSMASYKDNIHMCAFHSDTEGTDSLAVDATDDVMKMLKDNIGVDLAYPSFATDFRTAGILTADGAALFQPSLEAAFNEYTPYCGVAVSSEIKDDKVEITVKVASDRTSVYRIVVLVVQDGIKGWQKSNYYPEGQSDYMHRHVVRQVVTSYAGTFTGEKITDDGKIKAGEEASKTWSIDIDSRWIPEWTSIYALALDEKGYVDNMNVCAIDGGDSGFDIK